MILDAEYILKITDSISSMLKEMEEMAFCDDSSSIYPVDLDEVAVVFCLLISSVSILVPENISKAEYLNIYLLREKNKKNNFFLGCKI